VKWPILLLVGVVLVLSPGAVMAQGGAGRGGRSPGAGRASAPGNDPTVDSISREIAAGATEAQQQQFQSAAQSGDAARKLAVEWRDSLAKAGESLNYADQLAALQTALDKAKEGNKGFLQSFSKTQTSEFKDQVKKLNKAAGEVDAKWKALDRESQRAETERPKLSGEVTELAQALTDFRRQQQALGAKMGIRNE
jgi:chromosome segregation ATPase